MGQKYRSFLNEGSAGGGEWGLEEQNQESQGHLLLSEVNLGTQVDPPQERSHLPPSRELEEEHHPLYPAGAGCCHRQSNLSAWPGLVAPRPSSLLRPCVPPTQPSRSAHCPSCLSAPPARPRPLARHCREARQPEVSSQADTAPAPWPSGRRSDSPRRA